MQKHSLKSMHKARFSLSYSISYINAHTYTYTHIYTYTHKHTIQHSNKPAKVVSIQPWKDISSFLVSFQIFESPILERRAKSFISDHKKKKAEFAEYQHFNKIFRKSTDIIYFEFQPLITRWTTKSLTIISVFQFIYKIPINTINSFNKLFT